MTVRPTGMTAASVAAAVVLGLSTAASASAQEAMEIPSMSHGMEPTEVMILGVFHFHNPGADYAQFEGIDVLTPERQLQIREVADGLLSFDPTVIAVERITSEADSLRAQYERYRAGEFELTRNEIHQLGFRLAAMADLETVVPVDYSKGMALDSVLAYAAEHDPEYMARFQAYIEQIVALFDRMRSEETIAFNLRFMNEPENVVRAHEAYVDQATIGAGDTYIGARVVAGWYERNLAIFANLAALAVPGGRILFIVGAGHSPILQDLVRGHPDMRLVEANDYLPEG